MPHAERIFEPELRGALYSGGLGVYLAGIDQPVQSVRRNADACEDLVDAKLAEPLACGGTEILARSPQADRDLHVRQLAAKAARQVARVMRRVRRHRANEDRLAVLLLDVLHDVGRAG